MRLYATMAELRSRNGDRMAQKAKTIYHLPIMLATPGLRTSGFASKPQFPLLYDRPSQSCLKCEIWTTLYSKKAHK